MDGRTIPLHGGGELTIGGGPLIYGLIHGWVKKPAPMCGGNFMIEAGEANRLVHLLCRRKEGTVNLFAGMVKVCTGGGLLILWFYSWGKLTPDFAARLYDGAIDMTAEALAELCEDAPAARIIP